MPHYIDEEQGELARMFVDHPAEPTPGAELRAGKTFDYSVESLREMDGHLEQMRQRRLDGRDYLLFVRRAGAYLGEVIRRNAQPPAEWHWLTYDEAIEVVPGLSAVERAVATLAVMWDRSQICLPCVKVEKYLENGFEDSVWFYAKVLLSDFDATP